jgi:hypothetical protein
MKQLVQVRVALSKGDDDRAWGLSHSLLTINRARVQLFFGDFFRCFFGVLVCSL